MSLQGDQQMYTEASEQYAQLIAHIQRLSGEIEHLEMQRTQMTEPVTPAAPLPVKPTKPETFSG